jgi:hypothetical protein
VPLSVEQKIAQVRRPPSLPNWVRLNAPRTDETARKITRFVLGKPRHALAKVYRLVADKVTFGVSNETVIKALSKIGNERVEALGAEIFEALLPWLDAQGLKGVQVFHDMEARFPIGRGIVVPIKPTFVFLSEGKLIPVFVIGWTSQPFGDFHRRLFASLVHRSILTQEDFLGSDALVVCVPRVQSGKPKRVVRHWWVSQRALLSDDELAAQFDRFGNALDDAVPVILAELARRGE